MADKKEASKANIRLKELQKIHRLLLEDGYTQVARLLFAPLALLKKIINETDNVPGIDKPTDGLPTKRRNTP